MRNVASTLWTCPHRYRSQLWMSLLWYIVGSSTELHCQYILIWKFFPFHPLFCSPSFLLPFTPSLFHSPNPFHPPLCCILTINLWPVSSTPWVLSDLYSTALCVFVSNFYLLAAMEVQAVAKSDLFRAKPTKTGENCICIIIFERYMHMPCGIYSRGRYSGTYNVQAKCKMWSQDY